MHFYNESTFYNLVHETRLFVHTRLNTALNWDILTVRAPCFSVCTYIVANIRLDFQLYVQICTYSCPGT